ncbi:MAG: hypothetical protein LUC43_09425, partial [Burkholderiales bacterium]|nr:hypothetical protein [Burkholderiales bacterium]
MDSMHGFWDSVSTNFMAGVDWFHNTFNAFSGFLWSYVLIIMLIGLGLWFTYKTGFVQILYLKEMFRVIVASSRVPPPNGHISPF